MTEVTGVTKKLRSKYGCDLRILCVVFLSPELHGDMRARGNMHARGRRLLPRHATAHGLEFKPGILSSFYGAAYGSPDE